MLNLLAKSRDRVQKTWSLVRSVLLVDQQVEKFGNRLSCHVFSECYEELLLLYIFLGRTITSSPFGSICVSKFSSAMGFCDRSDYVDG